MKKRPASNFLDDKNFGESGEQKVIEWLQSKGWDCTSANLATNKRGIDIIATREKITKNIQVKFDRWVHKTNNLYFQTSKWTPATAQADVLFYVCANTLKCYLIKVRDILEHIDWITATYRPIEVPTKVYFGKPYVKEGFPVPIEDLRQIKNIEIKEIKISC
jgi:Holliday junction resolvase-like predicted endonuclease